MTSPRGGSAELMARYRGPIVQLTLRGVPLLDELVYFVKSRSSSLAMEVGVLRKCAVIVRPVFSREGRTFLAELDVDDGEQRTCIEAENPDLFTAIEAAFGAARDYLMRTSAQARLPALMT